MLGENLKRIAKIKGKKIEAISRFDHEEVLSIERKLKIISDFKKLNINFDKIVEINEKTLSSLKEEQADFLRLILEFLTLYKTFLFHWEKFLKNRFSENSEEYKKFRMSTNIEYDNYFSYRFINELRNYIQHCGYPNITYDAKLLDDDTPTYSLTLHSIEIIEDFNWKPIVLDELRKLKKINLLVVMGETVNSLYRINNVALNMCFDIKELYDNLALANINYIG
jgi:hypothetical protein